MDFAFTVCDQAASEVCPVWPGNPVTAHWGTPDPASVEGTAADKNRAFRYAFQALETRIKLFASLRLDAPDRLAVKRKIDEIGHLRVVASEEPRS
jgi:arsenate reductase (thioredoxin)